MVAVAKRIGWGIVACGLVLCGACARHEAGPGPVSYGSLKDDPVEQAGAGPREAKAHVRVAAGGGRNATAAHGGKRADAAPAATQAFAQQQLSEDKSQPKQAASAASASAPAVKPAPEALPRAAKPAAATTAPPVDEAAVAARNLAEGRTLFAAGQVVEARRRFIAAFSGPSPAAAAWALAQTFDTHYLSALPSSDGAPDMQRAAQLYTTAIARGAPGAQVDLDRVRATLAQPPQ